MGAQKDNAAVNFESINQLKPDNSKIWRASESRWTGFDTGMIPTYTHFCSAGSFRRSAQICVGAWRCQCIVTSHFQCQRVCFESQIGAWLVDGTYCARYVRIEEAVSQVLLTKAPSGQTTGATKWQALVLRRVTLRFVEHSWLTNTCTQTGSYEKPFFLFVYSLIYFSLSSGL